MGIVTTGVHNAGAAAVKISAVDFGDGQCIHVGAQANGRPSVAADVADDAGLGDFGIGGDAQVGQRGVDQAGGAMFGEGEFGVAMNFAPPGAHPFVDGLGACQQFLTGDQLGGHKNNSAFRLMIISDKTCSQPVRDWRLERQSRTG